jgi:hypothetical protein
MRLACGLAIALWLSFPAAGMVCRQQDPAGSPNSAGQAPAAPAPKESAPAEKAPAEKWRTESAPAEQIPAETTPAVPASPQTPAAEQKAPESAPKKEPHAASTSETRKRHKRAAPTPGAPRKIVVREGGAKEPAAQIVPGMTPAEAARERRNAEKLLGSTDNLLKELAGRTLNARQRETVGQIRNYMDGARSALKEGDTRRASTLAQKAHLLSEDLVKH